MEPVRYDIYFTGKLVEGTDPVKAQQHCAQIFKISANQAAKLFSGGSQLLKRNTNKAEALKFKTTLRKIGLLTAFKVHQQSSTTSDNPSAATTVQAAMTLAPTGSDILTPDERQTPPPQLNIDISTITLTTEDVDDEIHPQPSIAPPNTEHLSMAKVGADILLSPPPAPPLLTIDLTNYSLAPAGEPLERLETKQQKLDIDTQTLSIAPPGSALTPEIERERSPEPPDTGHLSIDKTSLKKD